MGKGGGTSGAVSYPAYIETRHGDWLGSASIDVDIVEAMNAILDPGVPAIKASCLLQAIGGVDLDTDDTFVLTDNAGAGWTYWFSVDGSGPGGDYEVAVLSSDASVVVAGKIRTAITNSGKFAPSAGGSAITIVQLNEGTSGNRANSEAVTDVDFTLNSFTGGINQTSINPYSGIAAYDPSTDIETVLDNLAIYKAFVETLDPEGSLDRYSSAVLSQAGDTNFPQIDLASVVTAIVTAAISDVKTAVTDARTESVADAAATVTVARSTAATHAGETAGRVATLADTETARIAAAVRAEATTDLTTIAADAKAKAEITAAAIDTVVRAAAETDLSTIAASARTQTGLASESTSLEARTQAGADLPAAAAVARNEAKTTATAVALDVRSIGKADAEGIITRARQKADADVTMMISSANAAAVSIIDSAPIAALIAQYGQRAEVAHLKTMNRFAGGMAEINAVQGSAFLFGMALLEAEHTEKVDEFLARLSLQIYESVIPSFLRMGATYSAEQSQTEARSIASHLQARTTSELGHLQAEIASIAQHLQTETAFVQSHLQAESSAIAEHLRARVAFVLSHLQTEVSSIVEHMRAGTAYTESQTGLEPKFARDRMGLETEFSKDHLQTFRDRAIAEVKVQAGMTAQVRRGRDAYFLQAVDELFKVLSQEASGKRDLVGLSAEANRLKYVATSEYQKQNVLYDVEEWLWQLKVFQYGSNVLSGVSSGGQVLPERPRMAHCLIFAPFKTSNSFKCK